MRISLSFPSPTLTFPPGHGFFNEEVFFISSDFVGEGEMRGLVSGDGKEKGKMYLHSK